MAANYVLLERIELNATAASVTFSNIPQTGYTDLKIVASCATDTQNDLVIQFNGNASSYSTKFVEGTGSGTLSATKTFGRAGLVTQSTTVFSSVDIYIPNYAGSSYKSFSADSVSENNGTTAYADLGAGLWSNNAAITQVSLSVYGSFNFLANSTFSLYGLAAVGTTPAIAPKADGGNVIATDGTYWYHAFLSSGSFIPAKALSCDVLVVAGGGGGGTGGGGAGGVVYNATNSLSSGTNYVATIGSGGIAGTNNTSQATNGNNSTFTGGSLSLTAAVGGGKAGTGNRTAINYDGGSGGGSNRQTDTPGTGVSGQGSAGGYGYTDSASFDTGGGGGGFSVAGTAANFGANGAGGNGVSTYSSWGAATSTGQNVSGTYWYAGGGSGGSNLSSKTVYSGGNGGGGAGLNATSTGISGTANTGGGGGGANTGGNGGSGIVIIRYLVTA